MSFTGVYADAFLRQGCDFCSQLQCRPAKSKKKGTAVSRMVICEFVHNTGENIFPTLQCHQHGSMVDINIYKNIIACDDTALQARTQKETSRLEICRHELLVPENRYFLSHTPCTYQSIYLYIHENLPPYCTTSAL
jgi:hypothetical protein